jgi:hypothetical protein
LVFVPTASPQNINQLLDSIRTLSRLGTRSETTIDEMVKLLTIAFETCHNDPVYWEGVARTHMLTGDILRRKSPRDAHSAYTEALDLLTIYPFSAGTADEQGPMIQRALWQRFILARKLGNHEDTIAAAMEAHQGVCYPTAERTYPQDGSFDWGPIREVAVTGWWRRIQLMYYIHRTRNTPDQYTAGKHDPEQQNETR